jgi:hypothetical protein
MKPLYLSLLAHRAVQVLQRTLDATLYTTSLFFLVALVHDTLTICPTMSLYSLVPCIESFSYAYAIFCSSR